MKKLRIFVIICISLLVLSGCNVKDNIVVNENGTVKEMVTITEKNSVIGDQNKRKFVDYKLDAEKLVLDHKNYKSKFVSNESETGATIYKIYKNMCEYFEGSAFNQYIYQYMQCIDDGEYIEIKNKTDYIPYCDGCDDSPNIENVVVNVKLPYKAEADNADEVNGNTYTWYYGKNTEDNKEFYLKISKDSIKESLNNYKEKQQKIEKDNNTKKIILVAGIIISLLVIGCIIYLILKRKYKSNKLDY